MTYTITDMKGNVLLETDEIPFVRQDPDSKAWISANIMTCTALAINGQIYGIAGRSTLPDYPLAIISVPVTLTSSTQFEPDFKVSETTVKLEERK